MKIAHIGNTSGIASVIAGEQKKRGHDVEVFVFNELQHRQFGGTFVNYAIKGAGAGLNLKFVSERKRLFGKLAEFNVWHYHYPYGSLRENVYRHLRPDQALLKHYHGDDLRSKFEPGFCVVSTPDLLRFAPNGLWVPTPVDIKYIRQLTAPSTEPAEGKIRVAHYPFYKNYSGYADYYSGPLSRLEESGQCEVVTVLGMDYPTMLRTLARCDIVVGKILPAIGWFGKFELEGMTLGKPVITFVSDELYEKYRPPIYRTTTETLGQDLGALIHDVSKQKRIGSEGAAYIERNHSVDHVCDLLDECYARCMTG